MVFPLVLISDVNMEVGEFLFTYEAPQHRDDPGIVDFLPGDVVEFVESQGAGLVCFTDRK